jgi:hypothetical protein
MLLSICGRGNTTGMMVSEEERLRDLKMLLLLLLRVLLLLLLLCLLLLPTSASDAGDGWVSCIRGDHGCRFVVCLLLLWLPADEDEDHSCTAVVSERECIRCQKPKPPAQGRPEISLQR